MWRVFLRQLADAQMYGALHTLVSLEQNKHRICGFFVHLFFSSLVNLRTLIFGSTRADTQNFQTQSQLVSRIFGADYDAEQRPPVRSA